MDDRAIVAMLREGAKAFSAGDMSKVLDNVAEDLVFSFPGRNSMAGTYDGRDGLVTFFAKFAERFGSLPTFDVENVLADGGKSVQFARVGVTADGAEHAFLLAIFGEHADDGRINRIWFLPNEQELVDKLFA